MSFPNMDRRTSLPLAISAARRPSTHVTPLEPAHCALAERERERYRDRSHCTPSPHTTPQKPSVAAFGSTSASALGIASASASGSVSASGSSTGASGGGRGSTSGRGSVGTRTPQSLSAYRLPTTSPPSERLRRLAPKPVIIPPLPGAVAGMGVGGKLELGGALRRGSKGRVGKESEGTGRKGRKEGREGSGEETQDDGDAKSRGTGVYAARGRDGQGSRRVEVQGDAVQAGASRLVSVVGLGIDMGFSPSHHPLEGNDERAEESGSEAGQRWRGPGQTKKRRKVSDGRDTEAQTGMEEMLEIGGLDEFEFAPCLGSTTYDPDRASRESSYISYDETRASSVSTTSSFGFDTGPPYPAGPITHSPGTFGLALAPSDDEDEKGGRRRYEYKIASPRSVDARRHAPDVPQEVVCPVWSSSGYSSGSSRYHTGKGSTPPSMGVNGSGHTNEIGSSSGSDDIDSFFLDLRPAARQGDELLSPQTYIANHTPRAVLVQFRDVFGGGDTLAPHLPAASRTHRSAPGGPDDDYAFPPRCLPADGGVMMVREESLAASFTETFGVGSHQAAAAPPSIPLADTMPPRVPEPTRPSLDVLPAHVSRRHSRTASRADSDHSFTFSAYMRSDDGDAESIRGGTRPSEESSRARSTSLRRRVRGLEMERLVPDMIFGESPAMDEIITPEMRISRLPEMAPRPSECEGMSTGMKALLGQGKESSTGGIGLGLGLNLGTQPMGEERYGDDVDDPPSPTPHSGRLSKEQLARIRSGDGLYRPDDTASALKITLNRPAPARPIPSGATDIRASPIPVSRNVTRPGTAVSDRPKGARQYKSFPNLKGRRPSTAPHDTNTFPDLPHTFARENEGRQGLVSSVSHNVFSATTPVKQYPPLSPSAKGKMKYTEARDGAAAPLSARSVVEAQQAITGATPNSAFSIDNFGVAGKGKDSRWKGNLKADVDIAGLVVARCTTINLWADQNSRESISTLYPIKLHSAARARQIDLEIGTSTSPTNAQTKVGKGAKGDGGNANDTDAFWIDGCVEFGMDPRARDKWMFRYGTLESWPLLKRITVNGSQNLDYVSRYASLHLKQAGIYTVRGSEKDGAEWRMRYMVSTGPPCLRADDRCIVIMAFYVNAPFLRGLHANKVGLASSLAKTMRPPIHAVKISTPQLIQASQVPVVPQIQLDAAGNETDARDLVAARPAGPPISRVPAGDAIGGGAADPASQLVDRANLPKRSTSIKRSAGRMAPMSPASSTTGEISQLRPRMTSRRPSTANSAIPHGTPTFKTSPASPIATPPAGGKAKESLMTTVRRRAATVWTRPSTAISSSPLAGSGTPVTTSPGVGSGQGTPGMSSCSPPIDPPNSAASGSSFSTAIGSFLKSKRSLANLKRSPDMDMTPTKAGGSVRPPMPGAMTMIDPTLRAPLSARAVNVHGRSAGVPTAPASSSGVAGQGRLAVDQNGQGHLRMHSAGSSIRLGTAVWPVGGRAVRPSTASGPTGQAIPGEFTKTSAFLVNRGPANQGGIGNRIIGESGSIREEAMGMDRSPPVAGGSRNLATGASGRRRPSTANGVGNGGLGERSGYGRLAG